MYLSRAKGTAVLLICVLFLIASGCGDEITNITDTPEDNRVNVTVSGSVISWPSGQAVSGADCIVLSSDRSGTSDSGGSFSLSGLSLGTYQLLVSANGHATSRVVLTINPKENPPSTYHVHRDIYLIETTSTLHLTVYSSPQGDPLPLVTVDLISCDFPYKAIGHEVDFSSISSTGQTDGSGVVNFSGMPATNIYLAAQAHDADGDGTVDYRTTVKNVGLEKGSTSEAILVMEPYTSGRTRIVATNAVSYARLSSSKVYLVFSSTMKTEAGYTEVLLQEDNWPYEIINTNVTWISPIRLEIEPMVSLADLNMDYDLRIWVHDIEGQNYYYYVNSFYWMTTADVPPGDCAEVVADLQLDIAGGGIDFNTHDVYLSWTAVSCAGGYKVYAKDNRDNTDWVYVKDEPTDYETGTIYSLCALPLSFDRYQVDGIQTPFAGIDVTFCVVPLRATSPQPGGDHGQLFVQDETPPAIIHVQQIGTALNDSGQESVLEFFVPFSEYIDPASADPVIEFTEAGGDPSFVLDPVDGTWTWDAGRRSGKFVFILADGVNASGDMMHVLIDDLTDLSGNVNYGQSSTVWVTIMICGGVYDFEGSPQGWTRTGQGWEWGTPTIGPGAGSSTCWGTTLHIQYGNNWNTSLFSPPIFVPRESPILAFSHWYYIDYYDDYVRVYIHSEGIEERIASFTGTSRQWATSSYNINDYAGKMIQIEFRFESDSNSGTYDGFFLDNVIIRSN